MDAVKDMSGHWPQGRVHFESFGVSAPLQSIESSPFKVKLSRSNEILQVASNESLLEALRRAGHKVPSSCESGTCGSCKTSLLSGNVDHRDLVLTATEKTNYVMVCVSRGTSDLESDLIEIDL
jgi:phthalate 4,5-dioxygenase reductase subunit